MAHLSLEGTLKENRSTDGALLGISQALQGLANSLQKFREVGKIFELESPAEADCSGSSDAIPNFLGVVAGTLKEMVGKLVSDVEAKPEIQELLVIDKSMRGAANEEPATSAKQGPSCVVETGASGKHSRTVRRALACRHCRAVHPEVMDPYLWSRLPVELVQLALPGYPLPKSWNFVRSEVGPQREDYQISDEIALKGIQSSLGLWAGERWCCTS